MSPVAGMSAWDACLPGIVIAACAIAIFPWVDRNNPVIRFCALGICIALSWRYMLWRIFDTVPPLNETVNFIVGLVFTAVELFSMVGTTITELTLTRIRNRSADVDRNIAWLLSQNPLPKVDVLICTFNEDEEILEATILGALSMSYPNTRIWVCDDGRRPWLRALCEKLRVGYLTRSDNAHAKAGNINAALKTLSFLDEKPDFVAILDADFIPMREFVTRALSLMQERDVGVVQTPQHFLNSDPVQSNLALARVWPDEQRFFFDTVMVSKDAWGAAFCCGTSSLIRFSALQSIGGGFPTDSVTEDYLLSLRLREKGFRTVYLNEILSLGLAPEGLKEYYGQRSRWCLGAIQICRGSSGPLRIRNGLPLLDRIGLVDAFLFWSASHLMRLIAFVIPALYLLFGIQAVHANFIDAIGHVVPYFVAQFAVLLWLTESRILPIMSEIYQALCATEVMKAVASGLLRPNGQKFKVTAKGGDRSTRFIQWPMLRIFLFLLALNALGIANTFIFNRSLGVTDASVIALFWAWYNIVVLVLVCYVCIEQPQRRYRHRFPMNELVRLEAANTAQTLVAHDISVSGIGLFGPAPVLVGSVVLLVIGDFNLRARVVRLTEEGFALEFEPTLNNRAKVIRHIFAKRYLMAGRSIKPAKVALAIATKLLR